jgi:hypothetical protein
MQYALRQVGTSDFVKTLPHNFEERNFVSGWDNLDKAKQFSSFEAAFAAKEHDPDGESLMIEYVDED